MFTATRVTEAVMNETDRSAIEQANRLYWDSDASVADIADQLGWSRRALYDAIEPLTIEATCVTCGTPLVYANRSARNAGTSSCIVCVADVEVDEKRAGANSEMQRALAAEARDRRERAFAVGGAALVGASMGAALTFLLVRRR